MVKKEKEKVIMKNLFKKALCFTLTLLMLASMLSISAGAARLTENPMVFVIGDSTAESQGENEKTLTGWGQVLYNFFNDGYMINNCAVSGESSRSFYDKNWSNVKSQLTTGDYVLIQFGHNDIKQDGADDENLENEQTTTGRYTDPAGDKDTEGSFKWYLNKYVTEITAAGATPILVTSIERRLDAYKAAESSQLYPYVEAMKDFADEEGVAIINIWDDFRTKIVTDYPDSSTPHPWFISYYGGDNTHLTRIGAMETARMFAKKLSQSSIALKSYLKDSLDSVVYEELSEKILEDFEDAAEGIVSSYNGWTVSGTTSNEKTPYVQVVYKDAEKTSKVINFYRDGTLNSGDDTGPMNTIYTFKNPIGADTASEVEDAERYVRLKYKFRSAVGGAGFNVSISGFSVGVTPSSSRLFFGSANNQYIDSKNGLDASKWYEYEMYFDLKLGKATLLIDGNRYYQNVEFAKTKIDKVQIQPSRCSTAGTNDTWSYFMDDIELSTIDEDTYCDYVGILPDETYLFKETFNRETVNTVPTGTWNEWNINSSAKYSDIAMLRFTEDPKNKANTVLAFQRTGVPSGTNLMTKTFAEALDDGYYELSFKILKHNEKDNAFELTVKDGEKTYNTSGKRDEENGWKISFNLNAGTIVIPDKDSVTYETIHYFNGESSAEKINIDKWYNVKIIYDLTGDTGALSFFLDGELIANNITPPNTSNTIGSRYNKGKITAIVLGLNRTTGSTYIEYKKDAEGNPTTTRLEDTDYSGNGTLIADVKLDDLQLKTVTTEPLALIYSNDATKVSGVKIKNERVANANEKMMVAVYSNDTIPVLKGVSECETITYGKTELSLKTPLSVSSGDKIKLFFWDMLNLLPKGYIEATK